MARIYEKAGGTAVAATLSLRGGQLCLDFANTVDWHASAEHQQEYLTSYADLVAWSCHAGVVTDAEARALLAEAERHPGKASAVLRQAIVLREALYRIFSALAHGRAAPADDVGALNVALAHATAHLHLRPLEREGAADAGPTWIWVWEATERDLDRMLWPVVRSATDLLTSAEVERVRECAGDPCGWLFLDMSKNRSRRWCDMAGCGNRAKARRHYARAHASRRAGTDAHA